MKRFLVIAALVSSTLFASAPARAYDASALIGPAMSMIGRAMHGGQHRRPPCHIMIDGRCVQPQVARRGYHPINMYRGNVPYTYYPPNIPGSRGYTGGVQREGTARTKHVTEIAEVQQIVSDKPVDSKCSGKPPGYRYDIPLPGGAVAHQVCGSR